jgi:hypothetical protein
MIVTVPLNPIPDVVPTMFLPWNVVVAWIVWNTLFTFCEPVMSSTWFPSFSATIVFRMTTVGAVNMPEAGGEKGQLMSPFTMPPVPDWNGNNDSWLPIVELVTVSAPRL